MCRNRMSANQDWKLFMIATLEEARQFNIAACHVVLENWQCLIVMVESAMLMGFRG